MTFPDTGLTRHDKIASTTDELAAGQCFDLRTVDTLGIEEPIEAFQCFDFSEAGVSNSSFDCPLATLIGLGTDQLFQKLQRTPALLLGLA